MKQFKFGCTHENSPSYCSKSRRCSVPAPAAHAVSKLLACMQVFAPDCMHALKGPNCMHGAWISDAFIIRIIYRKLVVCFSVRSSKVHGDGRWQVAVSISTGSKQNSGRNMTSKSLLVAAVGLAACLVSLNEAASQDGPKVTDKVEALLQPRFRCRFTTLFVSVGVFRHHDR